MDLASFHSCNQKDCVLHSQLPAIETSESVIIGIDEAGRGPVLGPMVYGACFVTKKNEPLLTSLKVADSKTLTEEEREKCFERMQGSPEIFGWVAKILSPASISANMLSRSKYNLNAISHDAAMFLIQSVLDKNLNVTDVFVDTVGDPGKYQAKLKERFPQVSNIVVSKKADSLFPVVSAASIVAKVCRDRCLADWHFSEKAEHLAELSFGSGYPGDPTTKDFLKQSMDKVFGFPQLIRFSWSTSENALQAAASVTWEDVASENEANTPSVKQFFQKSVANKPESTVATHRYFTQRNIRSVVNF